MSGKPSSTPAPRPGFDLDRYLVRIGYEGPRAASLTVLTELHRLHPAAVAFENLDPFMGREVTLEAPTLQRKLVDQRRGGYCFEQNLLFMDALRALGFRATGLAARVVWNRPPDFLTPRSHMMVRVELDGESWMADVGFGGLTQTAPLRLKPGEQETPHEPFRLVEQDGHFVSQALAGGEWRSLYRFDLAENFEQDYAVTSYFLSTHPQSQFVTGLMLARPLPDRRLALAGNRLTTHWLGGKSERQELETPAALAEAIETQFGIDIADRHMFEHIARQKGLFA